MNDIILEEKNKGNEAFQKGNFLEAINHFSKAIELDPNNHILYSNRSASYASLGKYEDALNDANKCVQIKPEWAKGYSRQGSALHFLGKYDEAIKAYQNGLKLEPNNEQLKQGLLEAERAKNHQEENIDFTSEIFKGDIWTKLRNNPQTAKFLLQPDFVQIMSNLQKNPNDLGKYMTDQRVMAAFGVLLGIPIKTTNFSESTPTYDEEIKETEKPKEEPKKESEIKKEPEKIPLTETQIKAEEEKEKGNEAYKKKDFENAIKHYNNAMELDPNNIVYLLNRAAVYTEMGKFEEALNDCNKAIEDGRKQFADYKLIAKAFVRIGNIYMKTKNYNDAVEAYSKALTEDRTASTLNLLKKAEKLKEEADKLAYLDPQKSLEAKERGNQLFKEGKIPEAIKEYNEAIARNPEDYILYSNRAACYLKLAEYHLAIKDCEKCIQINPKFVKAYIRKGHAHYFLKEYSKALEVYDEGLKLESNNQEIIDGINRTIQVMQKPENKKPEDILKDPEVQEILSDPVMRQILADMQSDPKAAQDHLKSP